MTLKSRITDDMKAALRAKDTPRLSAIRLLMAAIKQREVDERTEMADADVLAIPFLAAGALAVAFEQALGIEFHQPVGLVCSDARADPSR